MQYTFPADVGPFVDTGIFIKADGTRALTGDWDIGSGRKIQVEQIKARSNLGIGLYNNSGQGIFIKDNGNIGFFETNPAYPFTVNSSPAPTIDADTVATHFLSTWNPSVDMPIAVLYGVLCTGCTDSACSKNINNVIGLALTSAHMGTGNVGTLIGFQANVGIYYNTGSVSTGIALLLHSPYSVSSDKTFTTCYGIKIEAQKMTYVTTAWAVYQNGVDDLNYFAGKIGVGMTPSSKLDITAPAGINAFEVRTGSGGGHVTIDEWGVLSFVHTGVGIGYDSNISQNSFHCLYDTYITSGKASGNAYNILLITSSTGKIGLLTDSPTSPVDINANTVRLRTARTPASAGASGNQGEICWDSNFIYVCVANDSWKRAALSAW
jgi:hypothetical protein